jgi:alpha-glucosidase
MFRDGQGADGGEPPNNWQSFFGGGAWTRVPDGQWYLHLFDTSQPDWNWRNPEVNAMFEKVLRFWLDRGVAGFRVDVANHLFKDADLPDDVGPLSFGVPNSRSHRPELHDVYRTWRDILDSYASDEFPGERTAIAENWALPEHLKPYLVNRGLNQTFNPMLLVLPWNGRSIRSGIDTMLDLTDGVPGKAPWVLGNHDIVRPATRYGWREARLFTQPGPDTVIDHEAGARRARAAALLELALPGSAYVYQGEELGLPEVFDIPDSQRDDPTFFRTEGERVGRDGCRVPIPWSGSVAPFGFSPDGVTTWLPQPADWASFTVEAEEADPDSVLFLYRQAIAARPSGPMTWVSAPDAEVLELTRGDDFTCIVNTGSSPVPLPESPVILASSDLAPDGSLLPDTAVWLSTDPVAGGAPGRS